MDFTEEGLIRVENKGNEPELLGSAIAMGQSYIDAIRNPGEKLSAQRVGVLAANIMLNDLSPEVRKKAMERFRSSEIDTSSRVLTPFEGNALFLGLVDISVANAHVRTKYLLAHLGGDYVRNILSPKNKKRYQNYLRQLKRGMDLDLVKEFENDEF